RAELRAAGLIVSLAPRARARAEDRRAQYDAPTVRTRPPHRVRRLLRRDGGWTGRSQARLHDRRRPSDAGGLSCHGADGAARDRAGALLADTRRPVTP